LRNWLLATVIGLALYGATLGNAPFYEFVQVIACGFE